MCISNLMQLFCVKWAENTLKAAVQEDCFFYFVTIQRTKKHMTWWHDGMVQYMVANATDIWQTIDAGYAQLLA